MTGYIIPSAFAGTPLFFALIHSEAKLIIDHYGFFYKQTFRNRANVLSPNGVVPLIVPVLGGRKYGTPLKDIKIDYKENWVQKHLRALETYYYSSPFFEVLYDDIKHLYLGGYEFLWQLNKAFTDYFIELLDLKYNNTVYNDEEISDEYTDLRKIYSPKRDYLKLFKFDIQPYYQVYSDKFGFIKELSILDLAFNMGNEAGTYIRAMASSI
jgi:hypothetical protein